MTHSNVPEQNITSSAHTKLTSGLTTTTISSGHNN